MISVNATTLPLIMACNGSRLLGGVRPPSNDDPTARNEGIAAHWVVTESYLRGKKPDDFLNQKAPNGVTISNAVLKSVADFFAYVADCAATYQGMEVETSFSNGDIWEVPARCDFYSFDGVELRIEDFKHGFRIVEPRENWTLIAHAIGLCIANGWTPQKIVLTVHQPRVPHPEGTVREWSLTYNELTARYAQINATLSNPDDVLKTGNHCERCPSLLVCPAARTATFNAVDISMTAHAESLTDEQISEELLILQDAEKRLKGRRKQLEDLAAFRLKQGGIVDNFAIDRTMSNRMWHEGLTPAFLSMILGVDCTNTDPISPAQAIARGASETAVNSLSSRVETGLKLIRISAHKRAEKLFGKVKG